MSGLAILRKGQRWKALLLAVVAAGVLLAGGVAVGYASSRSKGPAGQQAAAQAQQQSAAIQLPAPESAAARQLLADPSTPGWLQELYTHQSDSNIITAEHTGALLKLLQNAVQASTAAAAAAAPRSLLSSVSANPTSVSSVQQHLQLLSAYEAKFLATPSSSSSSSAVDLQPFITAAGDVLSYLRYQQSQALLPLLRDFSRSGRKGLALFGADPLLLRQEVQQLLQPASLQQWYIAAARSRVRASQQVSAGTQALPWESAASAASASSTRRLMAASGLPQDLASALLSKMQGAGPTPPAAAAGGYDAPSPATTVTYASLAALQEPAAVQSSQRVSQDAGASSELSRSARVSPRGAAVAAPVPSTIGASAVADPDYLAFDFEDLGADGDSFAAESEADVAQQPTSGSSSSSSGARSRAVGSQRRADSPSSAIKSTSSSQGQGQGQDQAELQSLSNAAPAASPAAATNALPEAAQPQAAVSSPSLPPKPLAQIQSSSSPGPSSSQATLQVMRTGFREAGSSGDAAAAVCGIQQFSPSGLQQVAEALLCPAPHLSLYSQGGGVFRPVVIPVVFHCLSFTRVLPSSARPSGAGPGGPDVQVLLPPAWQATTAAGQNMIDQANKVFFNTGIQFKLQEVRTDPRSHAYLQQPSLEAWQSCSYNTAAPSTGLACLQRVASQLAGSTSAQAVHVIVAGSREEAGYCNAQDVGMGSVCGSVASGHSSARGPWTGAVSSGWREDAVPDNYVFLSWDTFSPATANAIRFANRGGSILASQLAQHLGLTTSTSAAPEAPGGCSPQQQLPAIASWCNAFRQGRQLALRALSAASNCPDSPFALLELSIPDSCAMSLAPSQVATLQAAVALYRPKLLAATAAK